MNVRTVIYATDLSVCSKSAGQYAAFLARHFSAELLVAHAFTLSQAAMEVEIDPALISEQRADLEMLLARKAERQQEQGISAESTLLEGDPRKVLPELAAQRAPCLLVLGSHGGGWVDRGLIGSVAETVLKSASCPVMTAGPQVKRGREGFRNVLYTGEPEAEAASYASWFAGQFRAKFEQIPAASQNQILRLVQDKAVELLVLGGKKADDLSGAYGLIVHADCPVLTLLS